ncbi:toll-like receptor 2 type-1 [Ptychodera flava]|uniref:toll-like receptor 2 type-1 n=1 Tax=Ptychodera flava TaxID=63121 RepID=UPI00396A6E2A
MNLFKLADLSLGPSRIECLHLNDTPNLEILRIQGGDSAQCVVLNELQNANISIKSLEIVDMCIIQAADSDAFEKLVHLDQFEKITSLTLQGIPKVSVLAGKSLDSDVAILELFPNLKYLSITEQENLKEIPTTLKRLKHLEALDLSDNRISSVDVQVVEALRNLTVLNLDGNPLECSGCTSKGFIDWAKRDQNVYLSRSIKHETPYLCAPRTQSDETSIFAINVGWECDLPFIVSVPVTCFVALVAICIALGVRFRWHIRYLIFMIKLKCGGYQLHNDKNIEDEEEALKNRQFDVFVVYSEQDRDWVIRQLVPSLENIDPPNFKLCIHECDFIPGEDIFENILNSIENSHKTMLVLSPGFAESEWCYFEMRMAQSDLFEDKRDVLMLVLLEEIRDDQMPRVLRRMLLTKKVIRWPNNELGRRLFWRELKHEIQSDSRVNRVANI